MSTATPPAAAAPAPPAKTRCSTILTAPFTVVVDSREQLPYTFESIRADAAAGRRPLVVPTVRRGIPTGDYSIDGYDGRQELLGDDGRGAGLARMTNNPRGVAVERKSIFDLFSTLGQSRARFTRELERLAEYDFAAVVVEATWEQVLSAGENPAVARNTSAGNSDGAGRIAGREVGGAASVEVAEVRSRLHPKTIYRSVIAWQQRFSGVHWWFCPGRAFAEVTTFRILERWWKDRERQQRVERGKEKGQVSG